MPTNLNPYLLFKDNAREAMEFYKAVFRGRLEMTTFGEVPTKSKSLGEENKIMHAMLQADSGLTIMASDTPDIQEHQPGANISMSLSGDNDAELSNYFAELSAGGTVLEPLVPAPWGDKFGMLLDKFGIKWLVNISSPRKSRH